MKNGTILIVQFEFKSNGFIIKNQLFIFLLKNLFIYLFKFITNWDPPSKHYLYT